MSTAHTLKVGSRVMGTRGMNAGRRMTVAEIRDGGRVYVMSNGAFLGSDEIRDINGNTVGKFEVLS